MSKVFYVVLSEVTTKEELQEVLVKELPLPDYYGRNLDALHDVLSESSSDWSIIFYNTKRAAYKLGKYFDAFKRLCAEASEDEVNLQIRFFD